MPSKRDINDARNSPAQRVIELLLSAGARVSYHDPHVPFFRVGRHALHRPEARLESVPLLPSLEQADLVAILTGHTGIDYADVVQRAKIVVDAVNVTAGLAGSNGRVIRLGAPLPAP